MIAFLETLTLVGLVFPGTFLVIGTGALAALGWLDIQLAIGLAAAGAWLGGMLSFYLGKRGFNFFSKDSRLFKLHYLHNGEALFRRYGNKSVLFGRFMHSVRSLMPCIAGMFNMPDIIFFFYNLISSLAWAVLYILLGYALGKAWLIIETWSTRATLLTSVVFISLIGLYWLRYFIIKQGKRLLFISQSLSLSVWQAIRQNPDIQRWYQRHPRLIRLILNRFKLNKFSGLFLTLLIMLFIYILVLFFGVVKQVITSDFVTATDAGLENLLYVFRNHTAIQVMLWFTLLGKTDIVIGIILLFLLILILRNNKKYILPLLVTVGGSGLFSYITKLIVHRPRPNFTAFYLEPTFSFPSGHATIALALYGFIAYYLWRTQKHWQHKMNYIFCLIVIIIGIGISRLYLGVHYLSDVIGGYLLGATWLIIGISIAEWQNFTYPKKWLVLLTKRQTISAEKIIVFIGIISYIIYGLQYEPLVASYEPRYIPALVSSDIIATFNQNQLPRYTETLRGNAQEPPSFIIIAPNDTELLNTMQQAGWIISDPVNWRSLAFSLKQAALNQSYPTAPVTPVFWNNAVNNFGLQKPTAANTVRERHHARFWKTNIQTPTGQAVYIGTASFDTGLKFKWGVTHTINPAIDIERETLFTDIKNTGRISQYQKVPFVQPTLGKNFVGDQFFTDGELYLIQLK
ncbi:MAG: LssY C-terminal domain-containing protein [Patescibacteria group bacterium]|jgi:undecaprenyl-diphosphatase